MSLWPVEQSVSVSCLYPSFHLSVSVPAAQLPRRNTINGDVTCTMENLIVSTSKTRGGGDVRAARQTGRPVLRECRAVQHATDGRRRDVKARAGVEVGDATSAHHGSSKRRTCTPTRDRMVRPLRSKNAREQLLGPRRPTARIGYGVLGSIHGASLDDLASWLRRAGAICIGSPATR